jgi:3',5'-cyclic AMP phosphodiesterase CpdA
MRYRYRVEAGGKVWGEGRFRANRGPASDHLRFVAIGDMGSGAPVQAKLAQGLLARAPELAIAVGDIVYPSGAASDYGPKFFQPYRALIANTVFYPTLGNHDVRTANGRPYLEAFSLPSTPGEERYYAFDAGPARFWALDSTQSLAPGSPQYQWLESDAAGSRARWKIAFFHHPPFSSGIHGSSPKTRHLASLFSRLGFSVVFTGHDHHYERTTPQGGVTYIVTGGGGAMLYGIDLKPFSAYAAPVHHFVDVAISGDTLAANAITADGEVIDAWSIRRPDPRVTQ